MLQYNIHLGFQLPVVLINIHFYLIVDMFINYNKTINAYHVFIKNKIFYKMYTMSRRTQNKIL